MLFDWICGGQLSLDDHFEMSCHPLILYRVTFAKTTFLYVFIFLHKIASVTLLSDWICGGQWSLDDHFELFYVHVLTYLSNIINILNQKITSYLGL